MTKEEKIKQFVEDVPHKFILPCRSATKSISLIVEELERQRDNNIVEMVVSTCENDMDYPDSRSYFVEECYVDDIVNLLRFLSNNAYDEDITTLLADYFMSGGYEFGGISFNGQYLTDILGYNGYTDNNIATVYKHATKTLDKIEHGIFDFVKQLVDEKIDIGHKIYVDSDIRIIVDKVSSSFDPEVILTLEEQITLVSWVYELFVPTISEYQTRKVYDILVKKIS